MNGYKTGGNWTDVTSIGRNEIVFEGRHKDYGAFYIRQRYSNALLLALLSAIAFVALCAFIPYAFRGIVHPSPPIKPDVIAKPTEIIIPPRIIVPPPVSHPVVRPPKRPVTPQFAPPVITNQPIDSAPSKPDNHNLVVSTETTGNTGDIPDVNSGPAASLVPPPVDNTPVNWVSEMPKFPGGKIEDYLAQNIQYPQEEIKLDVQGTVYVSFIIEKDGSATNIKVARGISNGDDLNREAVRVLSGMPKWIPGKQNGHPVRIQYVLPIHFKLQ